MNGNALHSYEMEYEYRFMSGIAVIDANRMVVLCHTDSDKKKYRVCLFNWANGKLSFAW
jgi:hypothetical protein